MQELLLTTDMTIQNPQAIQDHLANVVRRNLLSKISAASVDLNERIEKLQKCSFGNRRLILHPDVFYWIQSHKSSIATEQSMAKLREVLAKVESSAAEMETGRQQLGLPIDMSPAEEVFGKTRLHRAEKAAAEAGSAGVQFTFVPHDKPLLQASLAIIQDCCPSFVQELEDFVTHIHLFEGQAIIGFTDFENHGSIFLKYRLFRDQPIRMAEEIIHEVGHTILNALMVRDRLILNDRKERYNSPLRRDPRPMFGLMHQLFVLARLHKYYHSLQKRYPDVAAKHLGKIKPQLEMAFQTVGQHAHFTAVGQQLYAELQQNYHMDQTS